MNKMQNTARKLDIFFKIIQVVFTVGAVAALVGLSIIGAFFLFKLSPDQVGTGYNALDLGFLELELANNIVPNKSNILLIAAVDLVMGFIAILVGKQSIKCIRNILQPMTEGLPFHGAVSSNLKKLAVLEIALGLIWNVMETVNCALMMYCYDLETLLVSEKITHVNIMLDFDLTFIAIAAVLLLLSYVFRYGEQLQQLSDETL